MPRTGWRKSESDRRLPDLVSVGLLMKVFPAEVVDAVITECGRTEKRRRSLPARSMAYFAMGMALHSEGSYEDVLAMISDGLAWAHRDERSGKLANKAAISHARDRLGPEPMAMLFERVARPLAVKDTPGCWLAGRRLVAIDGTCLDLPDTPANDAHFGRPGVMKGERSAFPQARVVALAECGTHAMFDAVIGPCATSVFPRFEAVEPAVGQAQHPRFQPPEQLRAGGILGRCVGADHRVEHRVGTALGQRDHPGLGERGTFSLHHPGPAKVGVVGWRAGAWSRSMGPAWTCRTHQPTTPTLAGPPASTQGCP